jgi:peptide/nickel transport system permease protein
MGRRLLRSGKGSLGVAMLVLVVACAVLAPYLAPHDPKAQDITRRFVPPFWAAGGRLDYPLGTDQLGRDLLSRIIWGSRVSLLVGCSAVLVSGSIGSLVGLWAGFRGGWIDAVVTRLADIQLAIPFLVLAITVLAVLGAGLIQLVGVLGVTGWVLYGRVVRGHVLAIRGLDYIEAARALGVPAWRVVLRHVLPNVAPSINVIATLEVGRMILAEASLSFLGLGVQPSVPTWGAIAADGRDYIATAWWVATFPGGAILLTVLAVNYVGDWLRDVADPTLRV